MATNSVIQIHDINIHDEVREHYAERAVNMLEGKKVDTTKLGGPSGSQFVIPIPVIVTKDNFTQVNATCAGKPASYLLDGIMSDSDVQQFFLK